MRVDILTVFPGMFYGPFTESMVGRAAQAGLLDIRLVNIRDFATDKHHVTDDYPLGGGAGMVMKPEPIFAAVESVTGRYPAAHVVLLSPRGRRFTQQVATELAREDHLVLICGHYEGVDERVALGLAADEISVGDYVLTGGEIGAMAVVDAVARLVPGVLGHPASAADESFAGGLLEYPQYTRPRLFRGLEVPEALLCGHHEKVRRWRRKEALRATMLRRPDLLATAALTEEDLALLDEIRREEGEAGRRPREQALAPRPPGKSGPDA